MDFVKLNAKVLLIELFSDRRLYSGRLEAFCVAFLGVEHGTHRHRLEEVGRDS